MGLLDKAKEKAKQKAKDTVKTAVLGDTEFICTRCGRERNRAQVEILGTKSRKPRVWVCRDIKSCAKARGGSEGSIRHGRRNHPGSLPMDD